MIKAKFRSATPNRQFNFDFWFYFYHIFLLYLLRYRSHGINHVWWYDNIYVDIINYVYLHICDKRDYQQLKNSTIPLQSNISHIYRPNIDCTLCCSWREHTKFHGTITLCKYNPHYTHSSPRYVYYNIISNHLSKAAPSEWRCRGLHGKDITELVSSRKLYNCEQRKSASNM